MPNRITIANLEAVVARINREFRAPAEPYTRGADGKLRANIGNFHLSQAYGGVCLHRMVNEAGGIADVLMCCHVPRRELYTAMHAFLRGLDCANEAR